MPTRIQKCALPRVEQEDEEKIGASNIRDEEGTPMENEGRADQSSSEHEGGEDSVDYSARDSIADDDDGVEVAPAHEASYQLTPYVKKCYTHLETLRKRKRDQEERVETLVEEAFRQIELMLYELMRGLQERHAASHAQFQFTDVELTRSLNAHNMIEKKLKMIAAILTQEEGAAQDAE